MTDKYFNAAPEGRNEIFSGLKEFHRHYRAKFLGTQHCFNTSVFLSEHIYNDDNKMRTYVCVMPISKIIKLETLKDIVNEILPDEILHRTERKLGRKASLEFLSVGDLSVKENEFVSFSFTDGVIQIENYL